MAGARARLGLWVGLLASLVPALLTTGGSQAQEGEPAPRSGEIEIVLRNDRFNPDFEIVTIGTTVTWVNSDAGPRGTHDVYAEDGHFASPPITAGERWSFSFDVEGFWYYFCSYHEGMAGMIMVVPAESGTAPD